MSWHDHCTEKTTSNDLGHTSKALFRFSGRICKRQLPPMPTAVEDYRTLQKRALGSKKKVDRLINYLTKKQLVP